VANTWTLDATALHDTNGGHTFLLPSGNVLLADGGDNAGPPVTAELYTPASSDSDLAIGARAGITANATGPTGTTVSFSPPAVTDPDDATAPAPNCTPASGSQFAIGTATVTCTATDPDDSNSPVTTSFAVTVKGAAAQLADLHRAVQGVGPGTSLADKIAHAQAYLAAGDSKDASATLTAFINEVKAQAGKSIPSAQARQLIADARRIQAVLGTLTLGTWPGATGPVAAAAIYGYPYPDAPACSAGGSCDADRWSFFQGQCTSWVAYRVNQLNGISFSNSFGGSGAWGDAENWGPHAQSLGIAVNPTPAVGSVAWWPDSNAHRGGHVAYVEEVNSPTSIVISEMNYDNDNGFRVSTITSSSANWPADFIHIHDR
jgi:surface antigen